MKQFESFLLDTANQCLWRSSTQIPLAPKPWAILQYLVEHPGRLITHDELLDALWPNTFVQPQILRTYILDLRKALGDDAGTPRYIQTIPKRGYRFVAPVAEAQPANPETTPHTAPHTASLPPIPPPATIVGRQRELAQLHAFASQAIQGHRQLVFITGEVGIGKTTLVDSFMQTISASPNPPAVVRGQCIAGFAPTQPWYPVLELLRQLCASPHGDLACRVLRSLAPSWLTTGSASDAPSPDRVPGDLCAALEEISAAQPLVLVLEDLHWADPATIHFLSAFAHRRTPARLILLATFRPQHSAPQASEPSLKSTRHDLLMRRLAHELSLEPLDKSAMRDLLALELHQADLPPGLAGFVHRRSEGNPLFAIAILEHLIAQHFLIQSAAQAPTQPLWIQSAPLPELDAEVPAGLAEMIELELERLTPNEQAILEAGSLTQVAFPAWSVAAALSLPPELAEDACDSLSRRLYFLERAGQDELPDGSCSPFYVFAHGLFREVLYQRQAPARRAQRHIRIAESLLALFPGRESSVAHDVAMHFQAAGNHARATELLQSALPALSIQTTPQLPQKRTRKTSTKA